VDFIERSGIATAMVGMLHAPPGTKLAQRLWMQGRLVGPSSGDNTDAVAQGLQRTGRIITNAAALPVTVIAAFSISGITFIKLIGVGMAVAIVVDATIVRAMLVPATMRLLGRWNWWAPGPLRRWQSRYGWKESDGQAGSDVVQVAGPDPGLELTDRQR
jgi:RND superfamily putative drug exporter